MRVLASPNKKNKFYIKSFLFYKVFITKEIIMKRTIRLNERDLSRIVRRVIKEESESDIETPEFCLAVISEVIVNSFSDILEEAKRKVEDNGGSFENGETPSNEDWEKAEDALMDAIIDSKIN